MSFVFHLCYLYLTKVLKNSIIYYMTEGMPKDHLMNPHGIVENLIDDYVIWKFDKNDDIYYHKNGISDRKLVKLIRHTIEVLSVVGRRRN